MPRVPFIALALAARALAVFATEPTKSSNILTNHPLEFIDTSFEIASPIWLAELRRETGDGVL